MSVPIVVPVPLAYTHCFSHHSISPYPSTYGIKRGMEDIAKEIRELGAKLDKKDITVSADTDGLYEIMAAVGPYVAREAKLYYERYKKLYRRLSKIEEWKDKRKKKQEDRDNQVLADWNEAKLINAHWDYEHQPKPKWWQRDRRKSLIKFLDESGYEKPKVKTKSDEHWDRFVETQLALASFGFSGIDWEVKARCRQPHWLKQKEQIMRLHDICMQIRGAQIQVPSDLMQAVAVIASELKANAISSAADNESLR